MTRRLTPALLLIVLACGVAPLSAHDEFRIIGTLVRTGIHADWTHADRMVDRLSMTMPSSSSGQLPSPVPHENLEAELTCRLSSDQ
jgi:hypothetical protein